MQTPTDITIEISATREEWSDLQEALVARKKTKKQLELIALFSDKLKRVIQNRMLKQQANF